MRIVVGWVRERDPSRLLHYEGGGARTPSTDIVCPMYMRVWDMVKIAKDPTEIRPLILCEYGTVSPLFASLIQKKISIFRGMFCAQWQVLPCNGEQQR